MTKSNVIKAIAWFISGIFSLILLLAILITILLTTSQGREWSAETLLPWLASQINIHVVVNDVKSPNIEEWEFGHIEIQEKEQTLFSSNNLNIKFSLSELLNKKLNFDYINARDITIHLQATKNDSTRTIENENNNEELNIFPITIKSLYVDSLTIHHPTLQQPQRYKIIGDAELFAGDLPILLNLQITTLTGIPLNASIKTELQSSNSAMISGQLNENAGGILGSWLPLDSTKPFSTDFAITLSNNADIFQINIEKLRTKLQGKNINIFANLAVNIQKESINIENLLIDIDGAKQTAQGNISALENDLTINLNQFPIEILSKWLPYPITGVLSSNAKMTGPFNDPTITSSIDADFTVNEQSFALELTSRGNLQQFVIESLQIKTAQTSIVTSGDINIKDNQLNLKSSIQNLDITQLNIFDIALPETLSGAISSNAHIMGNWNHPSFQGRVEWLGEFQSKPYNLELSASGDLQNIQIETLTINSQGNYLATSGNIQIPNEYLDLKLNTVNLDIEILTGLVPNFPDELQGKLNTNITVQGHWKSPTLSTPSTQFIGEYRNHPINLSLAGNGTLNNITIEKLILQSDQQSQLSITGSYKPSAIDFHLQAEALPTDLLSFTVSASTLSQIKPETLTANLKLTGTVDQPILNGFFNISAQLNLLTDDNEIESLPMLLKSNFSTQQNTLNNQITLLQNTDPVLEINLDLPINSIAKNDLANLPINGQITSNINLKLFGFLFKQENHDLQGELITNIQLSGSIAQPFLNGTVNLNKGSYENLDFGFNLANINTDIILSNDKLLLKSISATDSQNGNIQISGNLDWSTLENISFNLQGKINALNAIKRHDINSTISGDFTLQGTTNKIDIKGNLNLEPTTVYVDELLFDTIPVLDVIEVNANETILIDQKNKQNKAFPLHLDLIMNADKQLFLRGNNIDTELQGKLKIKGNLANISTQGEFKTVRGSVLILDKTFQLSKGGWVRIENSLISFLLPSTHKSKNILVTAELSGTLDEFKLNLSSDPYLPNDEIISQLLFGQSSNKISPLQAIQLANALSQLSRDGKSLFNPIASTRDILGVDSISVSSEDTENGESISVGVGKYINDKVYVEIGGASNSNKPVRSKVEIELTPNLNLESSTGSDTDSANVELQWKYDY